MIKDNNRETILAMRSGELVLSREGQCWTDAERQKLKNLFADGEGITNIAVMLDRSETAIIQQIEHLNIRTRNPITSRKTGRLTPPSHCLCKYCECDPALCPRCKNYQKEKENVKC